MCRDDVSKYLTPFLPLGGEKSKTVFLWFIDNFGIWFLFQKVIYENEYQNYNL